MKRLFVVMNKKNGLLSLAAASFELSSGNVGRIQLLPYGEFRAVDGRPHDAPAWFLTEENGEDVARLANSSSTQLVVDYEHQTLYKERNGQPAPAAGWITWLTFTPRGLFADVTWTDKAKELIHNREYRYVSAVFAYDQQGYVRKLFHAALTNSPALDGLDEVMVAANALFQVSSTSIEKGMDMKKFLQTALNMPEASEEELQTALSAVLADVKEKDERIAALSAATQKPADKVDLTKYAPISVVQDLQAKFAALSNQVKDDKGKALIEAALTAGKLLPAQKEWALGVLEQENGLAFLSSFIEQQPVLNALATGQTQTAGMPLNGGQTVALSLEEKAAAKMLGMTESEYFKTHHSV